MLIFVVDSKNNIGHPTRQYEMIRRLLKCKKAKILKGDQKSGQPILVQLVKPFDGPRIINNYDYKRKTRETMLKLFGYKEEKHLE